MKTHLLRKYFLFAAITLFAYTGFAQQDSIPPRVMNESPLPLEVPNTFDFILQRGFLVGNGDADTASLRTSGSWFLGMGFKIPLANNRFGFRITPGINWLKINYDHTDGDKRFPLIADTVVSNLYPDLTSIEDSAARSTALDQLNALAARLRNVEYDLQRQRLTYIEVPIGVYFNIKKDEENKAVAFVEAGGIIAYNISGIFKYRYNNRQDQSVQSRVNEVPDVEAFRYGWYARLGYKKVSASINYRSSYIFTFEKDLQAHKFPQLQLGIGVSL
ncbi:MAG: outer membrane beta-barrel protein [Bacteroidia bacterium]